MFIYLIIIMMDSKDKETSLKIQKFDDLKNENKRLLKIKEKYDKLHKYILDYDDTVKICDCGEVNQDMDDICNLCWEVCEQCNYLYNCDKCKKSVCYFCRSCDNTCKECCNNLHKCHKCKLFFHDDNMTMILKNQYCDKCFDDIVGLPTDITNNILKRYSNENLDIDVKNPKKKQKL